MSITSPTEHAAAKARRDELWSSCVAMTARLHDLIAKKHAFLALRKAKMLANELDVFLEMSLAIDAWEERREAEGKVTG